MRFEASDATRSDVAGPSLVARSQSLSSLEGVPAGFLGLS